MIEAALERKANLSPKQKRHARFGRVVCLAASAPTVLRFARGVREGGSKRQEIFIYLELGPCGGGDQPPVASELLDLTSLFTYTRGLTNGVPAALANAASSHRTRTRSLR